MSGKHSLLPRGLAVAVLMLPTGSLAGTLPEVSVTQIESQTSEVSGSPPAVFQFTRTGSTEQQLLVYFEPVAGSEALGNDWTSDEIIQLGGGRRGFIFPPDEATYLVEIRADQDNQVEGTEALLQKLQPRATYVIAPGNDIVLQTDLLDDPPEVTIELSPDEISEGGAPGALTLTRSGGDLTIGLGVQVFLNDGTANIGQDFTVEGLVSTPHRTIIIPSDQTSEIRSIMAEADNLIEGNETIGIQILPLDNYVVVTPSDSIDLIDDAPIVAIAAIDAEASEAGDTGTFRISRSGGSAAIQLFVHLERSGTASPPGSVPRDYDMDLSQNALGFFVLVPADELEFDVLVEPLADMEDSEPDETVILTIRDDIGEYLVDPTQMTDTVIIENVPDGVFSDRFSAPESP